MSRMCMYLVVSVTGSGGFDEHVIMWINMYAVLGMMIGDPHVLVLVKNTVV